MIVQCDKCKTKFRIPDEKVSDSGVKVRCSRCAHVFMVKREVVSLDSPPPVAAPVTDVEQALREAGLDLAARERAGVLPPFPAAARGGASAGSPTVPVQAPLSFAATVPVSALGGSTLIPLAPLSSQLSGMSDDAGAFPIPSMVPEVAQSSVDAMIALGFAALPSEQRPSDEPDTVVSPVAKRAAPQPIAPPAPALAPAHPAAPAAFDDDPTASYAAYTPPAAVPPPAEGPKPVSPPPLPSSSLSRLPPAPLGGSSSDLPQLSEQLGSLRSSGELDFSALLDASLSGLVVVSPQGSPAASRGPDPSGHPADGPGDRSGLGARPRGSPGGSGPSVSLSHLGFGASASGAAPPPAGPPMIALPGLSPSLGIMGLPPPPARSSPASAPQPAGLTPTPALSGMTPAPLLASVNQTPTPAIPAIPGLLGPGNAPPIPGSPTGASPIPNFSTSPDGGLDQRFPSGFDSLTNPFFPPPPDLAALIAAAGSDAGSAGGLERDQGDIPGLLPAGATTEDPFAGLDLDGGSILTGNELSSIPSSMATPFDDARERSTFSLAKQESGKPVARIELGRGAGAPASSQAIRTARVHTGDFHRVDTAVSPDGRVLGWWPTALGLVLGVTVTVAAVVGPAGGSFSKLGPDDLRALVAPAVSEPLEESLAEVRARSAHVTAYTTRSGKSLLVIAGIAVNRGAEPLEAVEAVATIAGAGGVVDRRQALVGVTLYEDALVGVTSPGELDAAYAEAERRITAGSALSLAPGARMPFMVVFPEVPSALEERSFQVAFRRASRATARTP